MKIYIFLVYKIYRVLLYFFISLLSGIVVGCFEFNVTKTINVLVPVCLGLVGTMFSVGMGLITSFPTREVTAKNFRKILLNKLNDLKNNFIVMFLLCSLFAAIDVFFDSVNYKIFWGLSFNEKICVLVFFLCVFIYFIKNFLIILKLKLDLENRIMSEK